MDNSERCPFRRLVESDDHLEELHGFLARGGDPNQTVLGRNTLLHAAAQSYNSNDRVVHQLIYAGAHIDFTTSVGSTPLHFAVMTRNRDAAEALIQAGAQINAQNNFGRTALHYAVYSCRPRVPSAGITSMSAFDCLPDVWIMARLLDQDDINVNPVDSDGETPLMWAVRHGWLGVSKTLLKRGANPSITNREFKNCLHVALTVQDPNHDIVTELLWNGASIYQVDDSGQTPVDILIRYAFDVRTFFFVLDCLCLIALKYHVREELVRKVSSFRLFSEILRIGCQEVQLMSKRIIYDRVNLHDFAMDCFQERRGGDPTLEIYKPVVENILSGESALYLKEITSRMSEQDLDNAYERIIHSLSNI